MADSKNVKKNSMITVSLDSKDIKNLIYVIRGQQVMLDSDLAMLYQVETKVFNQAVRRNIDRFPDNFRFQLTKEEYDDFVEALKDGIPEYMAECAAYNEGYDYYF